MKNYIKKINLYHSFLFFLFTNLFVIIIDQNKEKGKASLRKKMFDKAIKKDNTHMQIWLSKNYLGMKDRTVNENINEPLPLIIEAKVEDVKEER